jgi:hypothetical protein
MRIDRLQTDAPTPAEPCDHTRRPSSIAQRLAIAALVAALAVSGGVVLLRSSRPPARATSAPAAATGTINGRLFAVGGKAGPPSPFANQTFELSRTSGHVSYTIQTDKHGRFFIHAKPGDYDFSMPHMMIVIEVGVTAGTHRLFRVVAGRTIRPDVTVSDPALA